MAPRCESRHDEGRGGAVGLSRHAGKLSLRPRSDEGEEILLGRALLHDLDGLLQLRIIIKSPPPNRGVAERGASDAQLDIAIDERRGSVPLLSIDLHARFLESIEEIGPPFRLDREVRLHLSLELIPKIVESVVVLLRLGRHRLAELLRASR